MKLNIESKLVADRVEAHLLRKEAREEELHEFQMMEVSNGYAWEKVNFLLSASQKTLLLLITLMLAIYVYRTFILNK